jgi:hypothetical protein
MAEDRQAIINQCPYYKNKLNDVRPEQQIFRIESFDRFINNIRNRELSFTWPGGWQDIFDGVFVRTPVYFKKDDIEAIQDYSQDYFCQCWSYEELEIMWKMWSLCPYETVMIVSTIDKIMRQIWTDEACGKYVGMIEYHPIDNMRKEEFFHSVFGQSWNLFNETGVAQTFLFKPDGLSHEKEVRFVTQIKTEEGQKKDNIMVCISGQPRDYIDKILVDPRASGTFENEVREALSQYGLIIERSSKNRKNIEGAVVNSYYEKSTDNYGLPSRYVFEE